MLEKALCSRVWLALFVLAVLSSCQREKVVAVKHTTMPTDEQALIVTIPVDGSDAQMQKLFAMEDELSKTIETAGAGEYDGNEIGEGTFTIYVYGPNADRLFDAALPVLLRYELPPGSRALKRYGKPGAKGETVPVARGVTH